MRLVFKVICSSLSGTCTSASKAREQIAEKTAWAASWMSRPLRSFYERVVGFAAAESILLCGSFCAVYWLHTRGLMPGLTLLNNKISGDKGLHAEFSTVIYKLMKHKLSDETVHDIVKGAVEVERKFICDALPCSPIQPPQTTPF